MAEHSLIEWTNATWNPVTGCSVVSPGCTNCYAMRLAGTRLAHHPSRAGLTRDSKAGTVWTGEVRLNAGWLAQPLRWRRPRMIFVCAHGDLFHEAVPDAWIDKMFAVMALAPQHVFQVLTKRPARMREYLTSTGTRDRWVEASRMLGEGDPLSPQQYADRSHCGPPGNRKSVFSQPLLPNIWLGTSVERQQEANERIPHLLATPAAVRWISAEPLMGHINLRRIRIAPDHHTILDALDGYAIANSIAGSGQECAKIDWVVAGGESGPGSRPMHPDWVRALRDQCAAAGVPFFFKQWGDWLPTAGVDAYFHGPSRDQREFPNAQGIGWLRDGRILLRDFSVADHRRRIAAGEARDTRAIEHDLNAIADFTRMMNNDARCLDNPLGYQWMYQVGKARAGRLLDGIEHNGMPGETE